MASLLQRYADLLRKRPLSTKIVTSALLMAGGDLIQQVLEKKRRNEKLSNFDKKRVLRMAAYGIFLGAVLHQWYGSLGRLGTSMTPFKGALMRMAIDQSVAAPALTVAFFTGMGHLEGKRSPEIFSDLRNKFWPTLQVNYAVWPAAMLLNFAVIPPHLRVLFSNFVGLFYNTFLSAMQHDD
ncbi:MAG: hypothetical protein MHM6MM_000934 [Cercozoa sp. M6MM]